MYEMIKREQKAEAAITGADFRQGLIYDFIRWIDRTPKTTKTYLTNLKQFVAYLYFTATTSPTRETVEAFREWLQTEHKGIQLDNEAADGWRYRTNAAGNVIVVKCNANTTRQYLRSVSQFFEWTQSRGLYPNIAANVRKPKIRNEIHRKEAFKPAEVLKIEKTITATNTMKKQAAASSYKDTAGKIQRTDEQGKRLFAIYLLTVNAGLRTVEISRANIKDLETKDGESWLYVQGKGHEEADQKKAIAPEVAEAIRDYLTSRKDTPTPNAPLFVATGNRSGGQRLSCECISRMLKKAMQAAGYDSERLTAHSLRHTAGTAVQEITKNLYATQNYMRHSNPATTEIYLHNDNEKQERGIAQSLYNYYHGVEDSTRDRLQQILDRLAPGQLEQLAGIAAAMA